MTAVSLGRKERYILIRALGLYLKHIQEELKECPADSMAPYLKRIEEIGKIEEKLKRY